jgi:hypothetical protein
MKITLLGDCHGKYSKYLDIVKDTEYSIQLGDYGFNYSSLKSVDCNKHKVLFGNHDVVFTNSDGELIKPCDHILDNFGIIEKSSNSNIPDMFYVRGGHSIDKAYRTEGKDWFKDEELTYQQMCKAIDLYEKVKPEIVLSHETPSSMIPYVANPNFAHLDLKPSATAQTLEYMYRIHQPKFWFHCHFHIDKWYKPNETNFFCLNELSYIDLIDTEKGYDLIGGYVNFEVTNDN